MEPRDNVVLQGSFNLSLVHMEALYLKILMALGGIILSVVGYGLQYMLKRISEIVPPDEIRRMIEERHRVADSDVENIDNRLTRLEAVFFRLLEDELRDAEKKNQP